MADYEKLRQRRQQLGLSQYDVAKILGIKQSTYSDKENGRSRFNKDDIDRLTQALDCRYEDIFEVDENNESYYQRQTIDLITKEVESLRRLIYIEEDENKVKSLASQIVSFLETKRIIQEA